MRIRDFSPNFAIPAGGGVVIVPYQALRGNNIANFSVNMTGAANALGAATGLTRIRVLVNGNVFWDVSAAHFIAWTERMTEGRRVYGITSLGFNIPFYDTMAPTVDEGDQFQLPAGNVELQFVFAAGSVVGNLNVAIDRTNVTAIGSHRLYGSAMNIPASTVNASYLFSAAGIVRGVVMNRAGVIQRLLQLGGIEAIKDTGPSFTPALDQIILRDALYSPQILTDPLTHYLGEQYQAPATGTFLRLDTAAGWAGVGNELTLYTQIPTA